MKTQKKRFQKDFCGPEIWNWKFLNVCWSWSAPEKNNTTNKKKVKFRFIRLGFQIPISAFELVHIQITKYCSLLVALLPHHHSRSVESEFFGFCGYLNRKTRRSKSTQETNLIAFICKIIRRARLYRWKRFPFTLNNIWELSEAKIVPLRFCLMKKCGYISENDCEQSKIEIFSNISRVARFVMKQTLAMMTFECEHSKNASSLLFRDSFGDCDLQFVYIN